MDFLSPELSNYIESHTQPESAILKELNRETNAGVLYPRMLSGHLQGQVLAMFSKMINPTTILEIGTYTGYSAICLAQGLHDHGTLYTIDINEELSDMVNDYVQEAGFNHKIQTITGNALEIIPTMKLNFDLVFIDADKENYSRYYDLVFDKVNQGGFIVADNVLWSGNILKKEEDMDVETLAIHRFNNKVNVDSRVENVLFPIRDGLMVMRKK